jgi:hypothetical protein
MIKKKQGAKVILSKALIRAIKPSKLSIIGWLSVTFYLNQFEVSEIFFIVIILARFAFLIESNWGSQIMFGNFFLKNGALVSTECQLFPCFGNISSYNVFAFFLSDDLTLKLSIQFYFFI